VTAAPTAGARERELIRRMLEQLLMLSTKAGHLALVNDRESLGRCNQLLPRRGHCSPLCVTFADVLDAASDYLEAHPGMPAQPPLWAETEAAG
jgi:hypothetical protein